MKKITLIVLLFAFSLQTHAQNFEDQDFKRNELRLGLHVLYSMVRVEYEYFLNDWSSAGVSAALNAGVFPLSGTEPLVRAQTLGLYRLYFGKQPATGFFVEGNLGITSGNTFVIFGSSEKYTIFGIGVAIGWKLHNPRSGVTANFLCGMGRSLASNLSREVGYLRMGIFVGKRFGNETRKTIEVPSL